MNISYKWLLEYLPCALSPQEIADTLTSIGLETGGVEEIETIRGGLRGLVIGHVLTCEEHPNSDHLHITTVDVGADAPLQIVCGAPNVAAGQKVVVATVGTTLYHGEEEFAIKKSKIRGVESFGMICSEVEIGVGSSNDGIIVLPSDAPVGMPAAEYYHVESDYCIEVDITPNRVDATSHYGVARDLAASLKRNGVPAELKLPEVNLPTDIIDSRIEVKVADATACPRYQGLVIKGITVRESPEWLRNRLQAIGLRPINNIVDITNYVLHEFGQPLHAFDLAFIKGDQVHVQTVAEGTPFVTLDGVERKLTAEDLMICDSNGDPMCVAGVFGGLHSGVTEKTKDIFLESANFNPTMVRRTARRLGLNTDSSFRFERGLDPERTDWALRRAASLILEIAGGRLGGMTDVYPNPLKPHQICLSFEKVNSVIGRTIEPETVRSILDSLEIRISKEEDGVMTLEVPRYRTDVTRDVDVIEEIMRIYGYNQVELTGYIRASLGHETETDRRYKWQTVVSEQLVGAGFNEILNNSLTAGSYYEGLKTHPREMAVELMNPLSQELNCMRQTLLFGGLETLSHNLRRKHLSLYLFEWGKCYRFHAAKRTDETPLSAYAEDDRLGIWICGQRVHNSWAHPEEPTSVFELKAVVEQVLCRVGIETGAYTLETADNDLYASAMEVKTRSGKLLGTFGTVSTEQIKRFDIEQPVYFAELLWDALMSESARYKLEARDLPRFPEVKRDLALLLDKAVSFAEIESLARGCEKKLLRRVELFDVYEGKNLPAGKKSYAVSFFLRNDEKTLNDKQIEAIMAKIRTTLEQKLGAQLR
ncbi:phenylalanine--tRNA ligase subunit beta [Porphyromonas gingivalis]|uniref:Phenylalanine--tRNA ligase beta subunit n=1 Tax=Porphyromonas gingivalis (strain ATCC 33277 / DSM 20709 / CIP 103683 / JCM 12257 / NCTC 11834 / 2561) TaxID=431947 RepID=B2RMG8_PORG3|nr:phenylalanine--tRNA ligase subunit beta [Porphyromonas gingivalis]AIJ34897.1 phenylalanyl-tRNA synthetase subunit beta [Porphyromonas gingivalis]ALJ26424.1 phenylalanyl-tRNA synthetase, beta subunit [Porphyromonas gingivalis 381]AUR49048.1 phenylalanine--tRNA ligase beta subunit [Porphyromonas gingivalis ATCC 33277]MDR4975776.1 phenylalanine--tRNA ligase subunit beta [Porphyromonas gingivalis]SJL19643.1 phenylalanine--tRNA ligase subunit beta [Porphyromonas gingivalis]